MLQGIAKSRLRPVSPWLGWGALMLCGMVAWLSGSAAHRRQAQQLTRKGLQELYDGQLALGERHLMEASLKDPQHLDAAWGRLWLATQSQQRKKSNQIWNLLARSQAPKIEQHLYALILINGLHETPRDEEGGRFTGLSCRLKGLIETHGFALPRWFRPCEIWSFIRFQAEALGHTKRHCATSMATPG